MKQAFLFLALFCQITYSFGQCTTTEGSETVQNSVITYKPKVTYFKCNNGYSAPKGFEWMRPTKIYIRVSPAVVNQTNLTSDVVFQMALPSDFIRGDDLTDACKNVSFAANYQKYSSGYESGIGGSYLMRYGNNYNGRSAGLIKSDFICLDCGLGYFAYVALQNEFDEYTDVFQPISYSSSGVGFTCGEPSPEDAFKTAYNAAVKRTNGHPVAITYFIVVNTKANIRQSESASYPEFIAYPSFGNSLTIKHLVDQLIEKPYTFSSNADEALKYIKRNNGTLTYMNKYGFNTAESVGCKFSFNNGYTNVPGLEDGPYPIFTEKIGASKQSGNAQKTQGNNNKTTLENNSGLSEKISSFPSEAQKVITNLAKAGFHFTENTKGEHDMDYYNFEEGFKILYFSNKGEITKLFINKNENQTINKNKFDELVKLFCSDKNAVTYFGDFENQFLTITISNYSQFINSIENYSDNKKEENNKTKQNSNVVNSKLIFDFGKIKNDQNQNHLFILPKNIKSATPLCGCVSLNHSDLYPRNLMAIFHGIANYKGLFLKQITVIYEDDTTDTLTLKGELQ